LKKGVPTVIAGRPNAGKSTLLNVLLDEDRAIVSDIPGTTRDTIQEVININGIQFRLVDTAGIRETADTIEQSGVKRTLDEIAKSAVLIYLFDVVETSPVSLWNDVTTYLKSNTSKDSVLKTLFVANKMDLNPYTRPESYYSEGLISAENLITLSAKNQMNIEFLKEKLVDIVMGKHQIQDLTMVTNSRHYHALLSATECLDRVEEGIKSGVSNDFTAMDIRQALHALGEITGEITTDDLLENIFSNFCIGK
jgi:tRNA modification GTPase